MDWFFDELEGIYSTVWELWKTASLSEKIRLVYFFKKLFYELEIECEKPI